MNDQPPRLRPEADETAGAAAPAADMAPPPAFVEGSRAPLSFPLWADVLGLVIRLHDREADPELIAGLKASDAGGLFASLLETGEGAEIAAAFRQMLADLPDAPDAAFLDGLAADFADIYLTHGFRAAPTGSVWMTEDHLERQEPMFLVRDWYAHYDLTVPDWRLRSDDHLVHELQFVQHLVRLGTPDAALDAAVFLDQHVLPWVPDFCAQIAKRAREPFHAHACLVTRALLGELRDVLEDATGRAREVIQHAWATEAERQKRAEQAEAERPFVPGIAESW